jgi:hypothetical protein
MAEARKPFEEYLKEYTGYLHSVIDETYKHSREGVWILFEFIDNWVDLIPGEKGLFLEAVNSLSGIILLNSWKLTNWISYEILCGKYFEAIRNLRFIFEGSIYAVVIEDLIESKVWEKWRSLSSLGLKTEIFELWEECKSGRVYNRKKKRVKVSKVEKIVRKFVEAAGLSPEEEAKYIGAYVEILSQPELYLPMNAMIGKYCYLLGIGEDVQSLINLWHELSRYQHFSHPYLETACEKPEFVFLEIFDDKLFKLCLEFYFKTTDVLYAAIAWRFPKLREDINEINEMWEKMFNRSFALTKTVLGRERR